MMKENQKIARTDLAIELAQPLLEAEKLPEGLKVHTQTHGAVEITCVQIAGLVARRILNYVDSGATLSAGQRYGFIRFGSRVDLYLPLDTQVKVVIGDKVSASSTVLAELS